MLTPTSLIYQWLNRWKSILGITMLMGLGSSILTIVLSLVIAQSYTLLFGMTSSRGQLFSIFGFYTGLQSFQGWIGVLFALILVKMLFDYLFDRYRGVLSEHIILQLRNNLFEHQLLLAPKWYQEKGSDKYLLRFSGDLSSVQNFISRGIIQFISDMVLLLTGLAFICYFNWLIVLLIMIAIILMSVIVHKINRLIGVVESKRRNQKSGVLALVAQILRNLSTIIVFNQQNIIHRQFSKKAQRLHHSGIQFQHLRSSLNAGITAAVYILLASVLLTVHWLQKNNTAIDSTHLFAIVIILLSWRISIKRVLKVGLVWKKGMISLTKLVQLLNKTRENKIEEGILKIKGEYLEVDNLGFRKDEVLLLPSLSFAISRGETLLIKGGVGSGKSLLVKILTCFVEPSSGSIHLDGHLVSTLNPKSIRRVVSVHSKCFPLIGKTVIDAIARGRNKVERQNAVLILEDWKVQFQMLKHIGPETPLTTLSENQKNLLQWIRLLVRNRPIWILDDPFPKGNYALQVKIIKMLEPIWAQKMVLLLACAFDLDLRNKADLRLDLSSTQKKANYMIQSLNPQFIPE